MENSYGIGVKNRYELLYSDIDPFEILKQQEEDRERRRIEKLQKEKSKAEKGKTQLPSNPTKKLCPKEPASTTIVPTKSVEPPPPPEPIKSRPKVVAEKGKADEETTEDKKNKRNKDEKAPNLDIRERGDENRRGRTGGFRGGRGRGRGGRGGSGGFGSNWENRGKREYDRFSTSDRFQHRDKKESSSNNNANSGGNTGSPQTWSNVKDSFEDTQPQSESNLVIEQGTPVDAPSEQEPSSPPPVEVAEIKVTAEGDVDAATTKEEEEAALKMMTLDEWKREQLNQRSVPKFNLRKPGEGEDTTQWKKLYQLKKKEGEAGEFEEEEEDPAKKGRQKQVVDIQINFMDSRRRGGRGGRGRGGSSRGGHKYERPQAAPKVDDWNDFPSLITA